MFRFTQNIFKINISPLHSHYSPNFFLVFTNPQYLNPQLYGHNYGHGHLLDIPCGVNPIIFWIKPTTFLTHRVLWTTVKDKTQSTKNKKLDRTLWGQKLNGLYMNRNSQCSILPALKNFIVGYSPQLKFNPQCQIKLKK